jgi:hypothetical protein
MRHGLGWVGLGSAGLSTKAGLDWAGFGWVRGLGWAGQGWVWLGQGTGLGWEEPLAVQLGLTVLGGHEEILIQLSCCGIFKNYPYVLCWRTPRNSFLLEKFLKHLLRDS